MSREPNCAPALFYHFLPSNFGVGRNAVRSLLRPQHDHFPQHPQAVVDEMDLARLGMIPAHRNFADAQPGTLRQIKQLDVKSEAIDASGLENGTADVDTKRFETTLRIPKR